VKVGEFRTPIQGILLFYSASYSFITVKWQELAHSLISLLAENIFFYEEHGVIFYRVSKEDHLNYFRKVRLHVSTPKNHYWYLDLSISFCLWKIRPAAGRLWLETFLQSCPPDLVSSTPGPSLLARSPKTLCPADLPTQCPVHPQWDTKCKSQVSPQSKFCLFLDFIIILLHCDIYKSTYNIA
jgi:hypothetical protein